MSKLRAENGMALPTAPDAERFVLASVLSDETHMHAVRGVLSAEDFAGETHRRIWSVASEVYDSGRKVDRVTVGTALLNAEPNTAWMTHLIDLDEGVPRTANLDAWVGLLKDKAALRAIMRTCNGFLQRAQAGDETPQQLLDSIGTALIRMAPGEAQTGLQSFGELVGAVGLQKVLSPRSEHGLAFPWPWLNRMTCGMLPAELWILAGHTSTGKTSAMLQHAVRAAQGGRGVAIFSLEVGKMALAQKACYQLARVDSERGKRGELGAEERRRVQQAALELSELPLYFDTTATTVMAIHQAVRRRRLKSPVDHVIVDYLQLLGNSGRHDTRAQAVGANAWGLKMLATDFGIPVLLLSQFSRASNKPGQQRRPELGDLKESGDIENHANGVWFIHRESLEDADQITVEFMLPKQRDGRRNVSTEMWFMPLYQRFEEKAHESAYGKCSARRGSGAVRVEPPLLVEGAGGSG